MYDARSGAVQGILTDWLRVDTDKLPLIANSVVVNEIARRVFVDDLDETLAGVSVTECRAISQYEPLEASLCALLSCHDLLDSVYCSGLPIVPNLPTRVQTRSISAECDVFGVEELISIDLEWTGVMTRRPVEACANAASAAEIRASLFADLTLPVAVNVPNPTALHAIAEPVFDRQVFVPFVPDCRPLSQFEKEDAQHCVGTAAIEAIFRRHLAAIEGELPIGPNFPSSAQIATIVGKSSIVVFLTPVSVRAFDSIHPSERRIDFTSIPSTDSILPGWLGALPISTNTCTHATAGRVLEVISPVPFFDFRLDHVRPLEVFEAPPELAALIESTVNTLIGLIIKQDIVPEISHALEVVDEICLRVLSGLVDVDDALPILVSLPVDLLGQIRPTLAAADVDDVLIREGAPELAGDELDDPDVAALLTQYRRRRPR
jgi:hypothetical protein